MTFQERSCPERSGVETVQSFVAKDAKSFDRVSPSVDALSFAGIISKRQGDRRYRFEETSPKIRVHLRARSASVSICVRESWPPECCIRKHSPVSFQQTKTSPPKISSFVAKDAKSFDHVSPSVDALSFADTSSIARNFLFHPLGSLPAEGPGPEGVRGRGGGKGRNSCVRERLQVSFRSADSATAKAPSEANRHSERRSASVAGFACELSASARDPASAICGPSPSDANIYRNS